MKKILLFLFLIVFYVFFIEPSLIVVKKNINFIKKDIKENIKIVDISDLHITNYYFFHDIVLNKIKKIKPDIILYTGDTLKKSSDENSIHKFFLKLNKIAPVYAIYGNWDYYDIKKLNSAYNGTNISIVDGITKEIYIKKNKFLITGLPMYYPLKNFEYDKNAFNIYLTHIPSNVFKNKKVLKYADIIFSGHTHGGQVTIPFVTNFILREYMGNYYIKSMYKIENTKLYVNTGLGSWYHARFLTFPEITVLNIRGE
ncbi:phosphohydrolase [Tepiditoga spiralis]|uniref:Phosphohydrolase n=1 Tax=Tepiditoga spiralis TaxID=2108365 RepID=A0A7G1G9D8_9BACT|nr:metallophosphoesterase [Tepiditoga spiralis]BBE31573.1 phosphohydrolase [Tepiditoga spiralis]